MFFHHNASPFSLFNARSVYVASSEGVSRAPEAQQDKPKDTLKVTPAVLKDKAEAAAQTAKKLEAKAAEDSTKGFDFGGLRASFDSVVTNAKQKIESAKTILAGHTAEKQQAVVKTTGELKKIGGQAPEKDPTKDLQAMMVQEVGDFKKATSLPLLNAEDIAGLYDIVKGGLQNPQVAETMNSQDRAFIADAILHPQNFSNLTDAQVGHSRLHDFFVLARTVISSPEAKVAKKSPASRPRRAPKPTPEAVVKEGPGTRKVENLAGDVATPEAGQARAERVAAKGVLDRATGESRQAKVRLDEASIKMDAYLDDTLDLTPEQFTALTAEFREAKKAYKNAHAAFETAQANLQTAVAKEETVRGQMANRPAEKKPEIAQKVKTKTVAGAFVDRPGFAEGKTSPADQARIFGGKPESQAQ